MKKDEVNEGLDRTSPAEEHKKEEHKKEKEHHHKTGELEKILTEQQIQIKKLEDHVLREKAEMINFRKRKEEESTRMLKYAEEDLVKDFLPSLDNLERAISLDDLNLEDEMSKFLSGFKMIYCSLKTVLEDHQVKAIDGNKKPFDPIYHEAVMTEHVEGMESGIIIDVLQKGYLLKDKVIRPAMVKVSE